MIWLVDSPTDLVCEGDEGVDRDRNLNRNLIFENILSHSFIPSAFLLLLHRSISCDNIWNSYPDSWCNIVISTMVELFYIEGEKLR